MLNPQSPNISTNYAPVIKNLKESNSKTFKVSDFRDLEEEIHIILKVNFVDTFRQIL
ncbi:hypothetical protein [Clostridium nigeriense]|uniref:hypothetical protein n=1 Tax=Clostridium nigeriense TaxID=1805470 RepID=UPI003D355A1D